MKHPITFTVNGDVVEVDVHPHWTLLRVLRDELELTGAKQGCGEGECGACTVLVNGRAVSGCLYLASFVDGADVATIEGFDASDRLTPVQEAFMDAGAFQCGYCTSGFIVMATQLLDEHPEPTDQQIAHYLSGNLCRCAAYPEIIAAVKLAARKRKAEAARESDKP